MTRVKISQRFSIIDGFLVETGQDGTRKIVVPHRKVKRMTIAEKYAYSRHANAVNDLSAYLVDNCDLFPIFSKELFSAVDTVRESFFEVSGNYMHVVPSRTHAKDIRSSVEFEVIPLSLRYQKRKYLYANTDRYCVVGTEDDPVTLVHFTHQYAASMRNTILCLQEIS